MYQTNDKDIWRVFREHHYLSADMNKASTCYKIYWDDTLVGFRTILPMPSGTSKYSYRGSRLVILPDYQNLGFGTRVLEFLCEHYLSKGYKFFDRSSHLRLGKHWSDSPLWIPTSSNGKVSNNPGATTKINFGARDREIGRIAYSFEYMGQDYANKPHLYIYVDDNESIDYEILKSDLTWLKNKYWLCVVTGEINTPSKIEDICLELGIRTQLLYTTKRGVATLNSKYKDKLIIKSWDKEFSNKIRQTYAISRLKKSEDFNVCA